MTEKISTDTANALRAVEARASKNEKSAQSELSEIRRADRAGRNLRTKRQQEDYKKYVLGGVLARAGLADIDPTALAGLLRNPETFGKWLAEAARRLRTGESSAAIHMFIDKPEILAWVRAWGHDTEYRSRAGQYEAAVKGFDEHDAISSKRWRAAQVTADQLAIAGHICEVDGISMPSFRNRGAAFDWIRAQGGDTRYRRDRPLPPTWEEWKQSNRGSGASQQN